MPRKTELLPDSEGAGRYLPWVIAVMAFLATLAVAGAMALNGAAAMWRSALTGTLTVEIPAEHGSRTRERADAAVRILRDTAGVAGVRLLSQAEIAALLEPWLGTGEFVEQLPIPQLIDVELDGALPPDMEFLDKRLQAAVPGARMDDHAASLTRLLRLAQVVQILASAIVALIALAMTAVVIFAVRASLAAHQEMVELLHTIGARDGYIAHHFQNHAMLLGLRGGLIGLVLATAALFGLAAFADRLDVPLLPDLSLSTQQMVTLALVPFGGALIALLTARITVMRALQRLL